MVDRTSTTPRTPGEKLRTLAQAALNADETVDQVEELLGTMSESLTNLDTTMTGMAGTLKYFEDTLVVFNDTLNRLDELTPRLASVVDRMEGVVSRWRKRRWPPWPSPSRHCAVCSTHFAGARSMAACGPVSLSWFWHCSR